MKINWKQFSCKHIWEDTSKRIIGIEREKYDRLFYINRTRYAINQQCAKCGKQRIIERRVWNV